MRLILLMLVVGGFQDEKRIAELIEKLRSDDVGTRDDAARALKEIGKPALPALQAAGKSADAEVAAQAKKLARAIEIGAGLSAALKRWKPGVEDQLAAGGDPAATRLFLEATGTDEEGTLLHQQFWREDLEPFVEAALRGAANVDEQLLVLDVIGTWRLRSAAAGVVALLDHANVTVRSGALTACGRLRLKEATPKIVKLLTDPQHQMGAVHTLAAIGAKEAARDILKTLEDGHFMGNSHEVASALEKLEARELEPELVLLLGNRNISTRRAAASALGRLGGRDCIPALVKALADEDHGVADAAALALIVLHAVEAVPALVKMFGEGAKRAIATLVLRRLGAKESVVPLTPFLESDEPEVRLAAVLILSSAGAKEAASAAMLEDVDAAVRGQAARAAGWLRLKDAVPRLIKMLSDVNESVCMQAADAIAEIGAKETVDAIAAALNKAKGPFASSLINALSALGASEQAESIAARAADEDETVREAVAQALGRLGGKSARETLVKLLADSVAEVQRSSARSLARLGETGAADDIVKLLEESDTEVLRDAIRALVALGAKKAAPEVAKQLHSDDFELRMDAIYAIGALGHAESIPGLTAMLCDEDDEDVGLYAGESLAKLHAKDAAKRVIALMRNESAEVRGAAAHTAGEMQLKESVPVLVRLLEDVDESVRSHAVSALCSLGAAEAAPAIVKLLHDDDVTVQWAAGRALGRLGAACVKQITAMLADERSSVRAAAARALGFLGVKDAAATLAKLKVAPGDRMYVADALCRLGSRDGVDELIRTAEAGTWTCFAINAVRRPAEWERLRTTRLAKDLEGNRRRLFELAAKEAGLRLEVEESIEIDQLDYGTARPWILADGRATAMDAIEWLLDEVQGDWEMILDEGVLRIVSIDTAAKVFKDWAEKK